MSAAAFLRPRQIAEMVGVTERTVRRWIADGTLPSRKLGGARLVARATLEQRLGAPIDLPVEGDGEEL
jgi:excisionase family DNA binding protein